MKFEIGQEYVVTNKYKKCYVERIQYEKDGTIFERETVWRSGTVKITPKNEFEVEWLTDAYEFENSLEVSDFEEWEFEDSWDGVYEGWETVEGEIDCNELLETYYEEIQETSDYFDFEDYVELELGYEMNDRVEVVILDGIDITK